MLHAKKELRKELIFIGVLTAVLVGLLAALYMYDLQSGVIDTWASWLYARLIG